MICLSISCDNHVLTQTFLTVGIADVSTKLELGSEQEAEKYIRDMVSVNIQY